MKSVFYLFLLALVFTSSCKEDSLPPDLFLFDQENKLVEHGDTVRVLINNPMLEEGLRVEYLLARVYLGDETSIDVSFGASYSGPNDSRTAFGPLVQRRVTRENEKGRSAEFQLISSINTNSWEYNVDDVLDISIQAYDRHQNRIEQRFSVLFVE